MEQPAKRYRVKVACPPRPGHRGFVVWANSAKEARAKVHRKGWIIRHVTEEPIRI